MAGHSKDVLTSVREISAALERVPFLPFAHDGYCPICERDTVFVAQENWLRDHYICRRCKSIPRERAIATVFAKYRALLRASDPVVHESSPSQRGFSQYLKTRYPRLVQSHHWPAHAAGSTIDGYRNENLESLTFADESIDLHVTQDVLEHVFDVHRVFRELYRTLRPGGVHIFTTPLVNRQNATVRRAIISNGEIEHLVKPPAYHGNPINPDGSLVTYDFGYDVVDMISSCTGFRTVLWSIDNLWQGIHAEYIDVGVSIKPSTSISTFGAGVR